MSIICIFVPAIDESLKLFVEFDFTVSEEEDNDVIVTRKPNQVNAYHIFMYRTVLIIKEKQS